MGGMGGIGGPSLLARAKSRVMLWEGGGLLACKKGESLSMYVATCTHRAIRAIRAPGATEGVTL